MSRDQRHTHGLVQMELPVRGHTSGGTGCGLFLRMTRGLGQWRSVRKRFLTKVVEPVLAGFKTLDDAVPTLSKMSAGMLARRRVATADVTASSAATQVEPPAR